MTEHDPEFLRSIFLMEAWDTVATVEDGLPRLLEPAPTGSPEGVGVHASPVQVNHASLS